jgi:hypothetical protein
MGASPHSDFVLMRSEFVIPAKAGIHESPRNLPAGMPTFAGTTVAVCQWSELLGKAPCSLRSSRAALLDEPICTGI